MSVRYGAGPVAALIAAPAVVLWIVARVGNGLAVASAVLILVPFWYTVGPAQASIPRVTALIAALSLAVGYRRGVRLSPADVGVGGLALLAIVTFRSGLGVQTGFLIEFLASLSFYAWARLTGTRDAVRTVMWAFALAGVVGALSVIYEYVVLQSPLVADSSQYAWYQSQDYIYRPGGLFGSPPAAAAALAMTALCAVGLLGAYAGVRRRVLEACIALSLAALVLTFTRAGWAGFVGGCLVYFLCTVTDVRLRRRLIAGGALAAVLVLFVLPAVSNTHWFKLGVERQGTLSAREDYWRLALPLTVDSPNHFVIGRGFLALLAPASGGQVDTGLAAAPLLGELGTHNQYVRTLTEEGAVGLTFLLIWLWGATVLPALRIGRLDPGTRRMAAALIGAVTSFAIASLTADSFRDPQSTGLAMILAGFAVTLTLTQRGEEHIPSVVRTTARGA
jgi:O-antigen ligase